MRYTLLEPLRGLAALWVFCFHHQFSDAFQRACPQLHALFRVGDMGVPMFFVLSGYCITASATSAIRHKESTRSFLYRRFRRIYLPYWCSIVVVVALPFLMEGLSYFKTGHYEFPSSTHLNFGFLNYGWRDWLLVGSLTQVFAPVADASSLQFKFTTINAVYWTLAIEVQFYLLVTLALSMRRNFYLTLGLITAVSVPFLLLPSIELTGICLPYWPMFAIGIGLCWLTSRGITFSRLAGPKAMPIAVVASLGMVVAFLAAAASGFAMRPTPFAVCFGVLLFLASGLDEFFVYNVLSSPRPFLRWAAGLIMLLGAMSYSLYLLHGRLQLLVHQLARQVLPVNSVGIDVIVMLVTCAGCYLFYRVCEKPFLITRQSASSESAASPSHGNSRRKEITQTRPKVLYLTHRVPHPPNRGDRIRTYHMLRHLSQHADVSLACLADEPVSEETHRELNRLCVRVGIVPVERRFRWLRAGLSLLRGRTISEGAFQSPGLTRLLNEWGETTQFDATLASSSALAPYLRLPALSSAKASIDLIDVDSQKWLDYAAVTRGPKGWLYRHEGQRMRTLEASLATWAHRLLVVSEAEAEIFRAFCPNSPITALANGVDVDYFQPQAIRRAGGVSPPVRQASLDSNSTGGLTPPARQAAEEGCVFVGALDYKPNIDGAIWFCRNVWPRIREQKPNVVIKLVGREPTREVLALAEIPGVEVIGTVPDVRPYLAEAAVVVVPLQIARGVQNKVLEAMAMGKAIVAAPEPIVGLQVEPGVHLLRANDVDDWVSHVSELLDDAALREELGTAALVYVTAYHRWEQCLESLPRLLLRPLDGTNKTDSTTKSYATHSSYLTTEEVTL